MRLKNRLAVFIAAMVGVLTLAIPQAAQASAYGCTGWEPYYCVSLSGSGTYVRYLSGNWRGSGWVCNAYATADFYDSNWHWYQTLRSGTQWGCGTGGNATVNVYNYKWQGYVCDTLHYYDYTANRTRTVCFSIHS
jgi:hypothetical protein